jgi:hypothetical protein
MRDAEAASGYVLAGEGNRDPGRLVWRRRTCGRWRIPTAAGPTSSKGSSRYLNRAGTKREAQEAGRERARKDKVEHIIQNEDGKIAQRNSYGRDPRSVGG